MNDECFEFVCRLLSPGIDDEHDMQIKVLVDSASVRLGLLFVCQSRHAV